MKAVKAGNTTLDICEQWPTDPSYWGPFDSWAQAGGLAMGHGLGISLHERPWINYGYSKDFPEVLEEGMVIALETYTGKYGGKEGVRLEEQMVVTKDGYDLLSLWPIDEITECWV